jgi:hypothetical protein
MVGGELVTSLSRLFRETLLIEFMIPIHVCSLLLEVGLIIPAGGDRNAHLHLHKFASAAKVTVSDCGDFAGFGKQQKM